MLIKKLNSIFAHRYQIMKIVLAIPLLGNISAIAQDVSGVQRSPEALAVIQRAVGASGGVTSINGIQDVVATGFISTQFEINNPTPTPITFSARGLNQLKIDSESTTGTRSFRYSHGTVSRKDPDGSMVHIHGDDSAKNVSHFFPVALLATALQDTSYSVLLMGTTTDATSSHTLSDVRIQRHTSAAKGLVQENQLFMDLDCFIDTSSNVIVRLQHSHLDRGRMPRGPSGIALEIYNFDDYRPDSGLLLPHQIAVSVDKRSISTISISSYKFNTGLSESDFKAR